MPGAGHLLRSGSLGGPFWSSLVFIVVLQRPTGRRRADVRVERDSFSRRRTGARQRRLGVARGHPDEPRGNGACPVGPGCAGGRARGFVSCAVGRGGCDRGLRPDPAGPVDGVAGRSGPAGGVPGRFARRNVRPGPRGDAHRGAGAYAGPQTPALDGQHGGGCDDVRTRSPLGSGRPGSATDGLGDARSGRSGAILDRAGGGRAAGRCERGHPGAPVGGPTAEVGADDSRTVAAGRSTEFVGPAAHGRFGPGRSGS